MSHYAKVLDGVVTRVIVAESDFFETFVDTTPGEWIQTSYNTRGGVHYGEDGKADGGVALRYNFAGVGFHYDATADAFYAPQPYASWKLNTATYLWEPLVACPTDGPFYVWDESSLAWVAVSSS